MSKRCSTSWLICSAGATRRTRCSGGGTNTKYAKETKAAKDRWGVEVTMRNCFVRSFPFLCPAFRVVSCLSWFLPVLFCGPLSVVAQDKPLDFAHDVVPILRKHCGKCHTGAKKEGAF